MAEHANLPRVVVGVEAPDHVQHMATDINDTINRLNAVITKLQTDVADLQAQAAIYDVGAYGR